MCFLFTLHQGEEGGQMKPPQFSHCEEAMRRLSLLQFSIFQCLEEVGSESPGRVLTGSAGHGTSNLVQCLASAVS